MAEHPNVTFARRAIEALEREGPAAMAEFLADDVVWHEIGRAEPRRGVDEIAAAAAVADYEITSNAHDILGNDEHVVILFDATATRAGRRLEYRVAEVYHLKDGKVTERWAMSDDTQAIAEFFA